MVFRCSAALCLALTLALSHSVAGRHLGEEQVKRVALEFGQALTRGEAAKLRAVLPARGKVHLRLVHLGPEEGAYSAGQVEAVFKSFLRQGVVRSFDLLRLECASDQYALAHARANVADRDGRRVQIDLRLSFQPEDDRWVLREIRETPP